MTFLNKSWRLSAFLCVVLAGLVFSDTASAQKIIRGEATVVAVNNTTKVVTLAVESKARSGYKTVVTNYTLPIIEGGVYHRLPTGRKTAGQISDLKAGQRVSVKAWVTPGLTSNGSHFAEVIIPVEKKKPG